MKRMASDEILARESTARGMTRARQFRWSVSAERMVDAYEQAIAYRKRLDILDDDHHGH